MKFADKFATIIGSIGVVSVFVSIWCHGWMIVRMLMTGLLLFIWAQAIFNSNKKREKPK